MIVSSPAIPLDMTNTYRYISQYTFNSVKKSRSVSLIENNSIDRILYPEYLNPGRVKTGNKTSVSMQTENPIRYFDHNIKRDGLSLEIFMIKGNIEEKGLVKEH